jgi:glycosyltransferase involved in cell wall biosynthesis
MRILCIVSRLLGNNTFASVLLDAIASIPQAEVEEAFLGSADYRQYRVARWQRVNDPVHAAAIARRKFGGYVAADYDALVVSAWDLLPAVAHVARVLPTTLALDTTPAAAARVRRGLSRSTLRTLRGKMGDVVNDWRFRNAIPLVDRFLPMSTWCARSLEQDYSIPAEKMRVTWNPIDLAVWCPAGPRENNGRKLLFVGNDLKRKGFDKLLDTYRLLASRCRCTLTVVSSDPALFTAVAPTGVRFLGALERAALLREFQTSSLLLFPTTLDFSPAVIAEAAAVGIPVVASDVGAIRDIVVDNLTGHLLPVDATAAEWAVIVQTLLADERARMEMGMNARRWAEDHLSLSTFCEVIHVMLEEAHHDAAERSRDGQNALEGKVRKAPRTSWTLRR